MATNGDEDDFALLMQGVGKGSEEAARELVRRFGDSVRRAIRRAMDSRLRRWQDSADFTQMVWASFFRRKETMASFHDPEELVKFLAGAARNKLLHEERRRLGTKKSNIARERTASSEELDEYRASPGQAPSPVDTAIANDQRKCLERGLSPEESRMVRLRIEGLTQEEIGRAVGKPKSTVRDFFAGLRKLTGS
jgi:RNA polymerase sigma factor (sigma-70 family)